MKRILFILIAVLCSALTYGQGHKQTLANLQKAYQAEANASKRYEKFAEKAAEEKQEAIAHLFRAVSKSESIHMHNHKKAIEALGGTPHKIAYEEVELKTTRENLAEPIEGEKNETEALYPAFVKTAKQEKATQAERSFTYAMEAEAQHEKLFEDTLKHYGDNKKKDYYVSSVTGATIAVEPGGNAPKTTHTREKYLKVE